MFFLKKNGTLKLTHIAMQLNTYKRINTIPLKKMLLKYFDPKA